MVKDDMEELQEKYEVLEEEYNNKKQQLKAQKKNQNFLGELGECGFSSINAKDEDANQSFCSDKTMRSTPDRDQEFGDSSPMRDQEFTITDEFKNQGLYLEEDDLQLDLISFGEIKKEDKKEDKK